MAWRILECSKYEKSLREPKPVINIKNLADEEFGYIKLQVDTGFEGSILLPSDAYEFFEIAEPSSQCGGRIRRWRELLR